MKDKNCGVMACVWSCRKELIGLILIIIATFITLITWNGFGIVAMFFVGLALFSHRHFFCHCKTGHCESSECSDMDNKAVKTSKAKSKA